DQVAGGQDVAAAVPRAVDEVAGGLGAHLEADAAGRLDRPLGPAGDLVQVAEADGELRGRVHDGDLRLDHVRVGQAEGQPLRPAGRPPGGARLVVRAKRHFFVTSTVELSRSTQSPVSMTEQGSASRSVTAGTRVTTAPSADFADSRPMIMPIGAVPDSRVVWKKPAQPDDPFALGKTRILPVKQTP